MIYIVLVYVGYSAVRNQFGSGAGTSVDADPAFHHGKAIIQLERNLGLYFEDRLQQWYLDLPMDGLIRLWNVYYGVLHFVVATFALVSRTARRPGGTGCGATRWRSRRCWPWSGSPRSR